MESYSEDLIKVRVTVTSVKNFIRLTIAIFLVLIGLMATWVSGGLLLPLACILLVISYFLVKKKSLEYEYTFTTGKLDIDVITNKKRRKRAVSIDFDSVIYMAPEESESINQLLEKEDKIKRLDYSSHEPSDNKYSILLNYRGRFTNLVIEPSEKTLELMKLSAYKKVEIEK